MQLNRPLCGSLRSPRARKKAPRRRGQARPQPNAEPEELRLVNLGAGLAHSHRTEIGLAMAIVSAAAMCADSR